MDIQETPVDENIVLTADIVSAFVSNNTVETDSVAGLITSVHQALSGLGSPEPKTQPEPAVSIRKSIKPDHVTCLECGKQMKMLKRHIGNEHGLTPEEYRERWNLAEDHALVAPNYADTRRQIAKDIGLGTIGSPKRGRKKST